MDTRQAIPNTNPEVLMFNQTVDRHLIQSSACRKLLQSDTYCWAYQIVMMHQTTHLKQEIYQQWSITKKNALFSIECRRRDGSIISFCSLPTHFVTHSDEFEDIVWYLIGDHHMLENEIAKAS